MIVIAPINWYVFVGNRRTLRACPGTDAFEFKTLLRRFTAPVATDQFTTNQSAPSNQEKTPFPLHEHGVTHQSNSLSSLLIFRRYHSGILVMKSVTHFGIDLSWIDEVCSAKRLAVVQQESAVGNIQSLD